MNEQRLGRALNYISDELISEAADCGAEKKSNSPRLLNCLKVGTAAVCTAAAIVGAFAVKSWAELHQKDVASLLNPADSKDIFSLVSNNQSPPNADKAFPFDSASAEPSLSDFISKYPNAIWAAEEDVEDTSGGLKSKIPLGTVKISDKLSEMIGKAPGAVYAVMVSFEPCFDEYEMYEWLNSNTNLSELNNELKLQSFDSPKDAAKIKELTEQIDELYYEYYTLKLDGFRESFAQQALEIYPIPRGGAEKYNYFYCFAAGSQIKNFSCKKDEAFIFRLAKLIEIPQE